MEEEEPPQPLTEADTTKTSHAYMEPKREAEEKENEVNIFLNF